MESVPGVFEIFETKNKRLNINKTLNNQNGYGRRKMEIVSVAKRTRNKTPSRKS